MRYPLFCVVPPATLHLRIKFIPQLGLNTWTCEWGLDPHSNGKPRERHTKGKGASLSPTRTPCPTWSRSFYFFLLVAKQSSLRIVKWQEIDKGMLIVSYQIRGKMLTLENKKRANRRTNVAQEKTGHFSRQTNIE